MQVQHQYAFKKNVKTEFENSVKRLSVFALSTRHKIPWINP